MMTVIKEITVSRSVKINTGNYEATDHFISVKGELDEFDDEMEVEFELTNHINQMMTRQIVANYRARGKNMSPDMVAKHHGLYQLKVRK
jgi:hypothetical protein